MEITRGNTAVTAESVTSTPVPTPTEKPADSGSGEQSGNGGLAGQAGENGWKDLKTGVININTAGAEELMSLPGIGESRAAWIIEYRTKNGPFLKKEDIMQVKGIKDGIFSKIKDRISVE